DIAKGSHFILPSDVETWQIKGELELIVSHP
ncbi:MAG: mannose-6-phosphate isomerase, partial [Streptococcus salivarius]